MFHTRYTRMMQIATMLEMIAVTAGFALCFVALMRLM